MGRHSLPDAVRAADAQRRVRPRAPAPHRRHRHAARPRASRPGPAVAVQRRAAVLRRVLRGLTPCGSTVAASPDIAPALRDRGRPGPEDEASRSDGHCLDVKVVSRPRAYEVAERARRRGPQPRTSRCGCPTPTSGSTAPSDLGPGSAAPLDPLGADRLLPGRGRRHGADGGRSGWAGRRRRTPGRELARRDRGGDGPRLGAADPARSATGLLALAQHRRLRPRRQGADATPRSRPPRSARRSGSPTATRRSCETASADDSGAEEGDPSATRRWSYPSRPPSPTTRRPTARASLDLFYPKDGTPQLDYPYTLVDERELTTDQGRAATALPDPAHRRAREPPAPCRSTASAPADGDGRATPSSRRRAAASRSRTPHARAPGPPSAKAAPGDAGHVDDHRAERPADHGRRRLGLDGRRRCRAAARRRMDVTKASLLQALTTLHPGGRDRAVGVRHRRWTATRTTASWCATAPARATRPRAAPPSATKLAAAFDGAAAASRAARPGCTTPRWPRTRRPERRIVKGKFNALVILTDGVQPGPGQHLPHCADHRAQGARRPGAPRAAHRHRGGPGRRPRGGRPRSRGSTGGVGLRGERPGADPGGHPQGHHDGRAERTRRPGVRAAPRPEPLHPPRTGPAADTPAAVRARPSNGLHAAVRTCLRAPGTRPARCAPAPRCASARA